MPGLAYPETCVDKCLEKDIQESSPQSGQNFSSEGKNKSHRSQAILWIFGSIFIIPRLPYPGTLVLISEIILEASVEDRFRVVFSISPRDFPSCSSRYDRYLICL